MAASARRLAGSRFLIFNSSMAADLWLSPLSTLAGATAAILGGSITSWINDWRRDARDRKQLAASLAGELRGFKTLFDMYQPGVKLRRLETQTDGRFVETLAGVIPLRGVYFKSSTRMLQRSACCRPIWPIACPWFTSYFERSQKSFLVWRSSTNSEWVRKTSKTSTSS
jgi:hypothetical protein